MTISDAASDSTVIELVADNDESGLQDIGDDLRLVEALLFASASAVTERTIAERLGDDADVPDLLNRLKALYKGRGVELTRAGNRWFFRTAPDLGDRLKLEKIVPRKLSRAGTETLAIIAYHQPVTRAEIEEIRGVVISRGTLDILLEEGWIKPKGKRHTPGRPTTWGTSDAFLDHFGLESLNDLPGIDELKAAGLLDTGKGLAAYTARVQEGETLLFDTEESDEILEPLVDDDVSPILTEPSALLEDGEPSPTEAEDDTDEESSSEPASSSEESAQPAAENETAEGDSTDEESSSEPASSSEELACSPKFGPRRLRESG